VGRLDEARIRPGVRRQLTEEIRDRKQNVGSGSAKT
jgi:hypothetical protein